MSVAHGIILNSSVLWASLCASAGLCQPFIIIPFVPLPTVCGSEAVPVIRLVVFLL